MGDTAYTVGRMATYDPLFDDGNPHWKLGQIDRETGAQRRVADDDSKIVPEGGKPYMGGWVWRSVASARAYMDSSFWQDDWPRDEFGVYEIELPSDWAHDVSAVADPKLGCFRLINDARLVRKAWP